MGEGVSWSGIPRYSPNGVAYHRTEPDPFGRGWYDKYRKGLGKKAKVRRTEDGYPMSDDNYYYKGPGLPPLAAWVRKRRTALNLTQVELGDRCGVPQSHVSRWESGTRIPNAAQREALREVLGRNLPMDGLSRGR